MAKKSKFNKRTAFLLTVMGVLVIGAVAVLVVAVQPKDPELFAKRAAELQAEKKYSDAYANFRTAAGEAERAHSKRLPDILVAWGEAMQTWRTSDPTLGQTKSRELFRDARGLFVKALQVDPKHLQARRLLVETESYIAENSKEPDWLPYIESVSKLIDLVPEEHELLYQRATAKARAGKANSQYVDFALEDFKKLLQMAPQEEKYWITLAEILREYARPKEAESTFLEALKANPASVDIRIAFAEFLVAHDRKAEALPLLRKAIELKPKGAKGYLAMASYYQRERDPDKAADYLKQAAEAEPGDYRAYVRLAWLLAFGKQGDQAETMTKQRDQAETVLKKGLEAVGKAAGPKMQGQELALYQEGVVELNHQLADLLLDKLSAADEGPPTATQSGLGGQRDKLLPRVNQAIQEMRAMREDDLRITKIQGRIALLDGKVVEAERLLRAAYDRIPPPNLDLKLTQLLINVYYRLGQPGDAQKIVERYLSVARDDPVALMTLVRLHLQYRQYDQAQKRLQSLWSLQPHNKLLPALLAGLEAVSGRLSRIPPEVKEVDEHSLRMFLERAQGMWQEGDQTGAIELVKDVVNREPRHLGAWGLLVQYYQSRGDLTAARGVIEQAKAVFENQPRIVEALEMALVTDPARILAEQLRQAEAEKDPVLRYLRMASAYARANQPDKYGECLKKAEEETKGKLDARVVEPLFGYALSRSDWAEAEKYARQAADANLDEVNGKLFQAHLARAQRKYDEAVRLASEVIKQRSRFSAAHSFLGSCYLALRQWEQAREEYETAYAQNPTSVEALRGLISVSEAMGRDADYANYVAQAYRFLSNDPEIRERYLLLHQTEENPQQVIRVREEMRRTQPKNLFNLMQLAALYARAGRDSEAEAIYRQLLADAPGDIQAHRLLADFLHRTNRPAEASALLTDMAAKAADKDKILAYLTLGDYLESANDLDQAKAAYQKAVAADPQDGRGLLYLAAFTARRGNWSEAAEFQQKCLERVGDKARPEVHRLLVYYLIQAKRLDDARELIDKMLAKDPRDAAAWTLRGKAYLAGEELDKAKESFDQALRDAPNDAEALAGRSDVALARNDTGSAIADLEEARKFDPSPATVLRLGDVYASIGDFGNAYNVVHGLLVQRPGFMPALLAEVQLCRRFEKWSQCEQALAAGKKAAPKSPVFHVREAEMWLARNDATKAVQAAETASRLAPQDNDPSVVNSARMLLGESQLLAGRFDAALATVAPLKGHLELGPPATAISGAAKARKNDQAGAEADFTDALKAAKDESQVNFIVQCVRKTHSPEQAQEKLTRWQAQRPDDWVIPKLLAEMAQAKGDYPASIAFLNKSLALVKTDEHKAAVLERLALMYQLTNRPEEALKAYETCVKIRPKDGGMINNLAWLLAKDLRRVDDGLVYAKKAAELMPSNSDILDTYGMILRMKGDLPEAERILNRSIDARSSGANRLHLGEVYERMGRKADALRQYKLAWELLKDNPKNTDYEEVRRALERLGEPVRTPK